MYKESEKCPYQLPQMGATDPVTGKTYTSLAMCELNSKYCLLETGDKCDAFEELLKEEQSLLPTATIGRRLCLALSRLAVLLRLSSLL